MDVRELEPLEAQPVIRLPPLRQSIKSTAPACYQAPLRVVRLLLFLILLPTLLIILPLYMRYRVFSSQMYPMSMTDMRLIDGKVSPTWCQRQVVRSNTTFNAFVVSGAPELSNDLVPVNMTRTMVLKADMKEYWGFYLLQGSSVTVSACVRRPGASLIMIRGYKHLKECAYIGDDSSEEVDELIEAEKLGLLSHETLMQKLELLKKVDGKANQPDTMKRHKAGVSFHDPSQAENVSSSAPVPVVDVTDHDPKDLREILEHLHAIKQALKDKAASAFRLPDHLEAVRQLHRHRDTNVDKEERKHLTFKDLLNRTNTADNETETLDLFKEENRREQKKEIKTTAVPITEIISTTTQTLSVAPIQVITERVIENTIQENNTTSETLNNNKTIEEVNEVLVNKTSIHNSEELLTVIKEETKHTGLDDNKYDPDQDSKEIFEDVLKRLQALGDRGTRVLHRLQQSMGVPEEILSPNSIKDDDLISKMKGSSEELDRLRQVLVEAIDEERDKSKRHHELNHIQDEKTRTRRQIVLGGEKGFEQMLNEDDEARDYAAEEIQDLQPDGYAEHHTKVNETTPFDMSDSEFWSSFSSSEEALLECDGLILNLPLTPHVKCEAGNSEDARLKAAQRNALTYRVPANGYYFFVFNSENEKQDNFISVRFDLQKTRYDVTRTVLRECMNSTERCDLALDIFSSQKVVLELPLRNNDSLWNEQFVVISECEPRTSIYLVCAITVPFLIMVFAFQ